MLRGLTGLAGVQFGQAGEGHVRRALTVWVREKPRLTILLCCRCSEEDEAH